ncbi:MAG: DUF6941 family protein [Chloroflexota bacterium]
MQVDFAFLCDAANQHGSTINALGVGIDTFWASSVPFTRPSFHIVARVRASAAEAGEKDLQIRFIDADGQNVVPAITGKFTVQSPRRGTTSAVNLAIAMNNVRFERFGDYSIHVVISGEERAVLPVHVVQSEQRQQGSQQQNA